MTDGRTHHATCWRQHLDCAARHIEELETLLRELRAHGVEFEDERVRYVSIQIGRQDWLALRDLRLSTDCVWSGPEGQTCNADATSGELCRKHRAIVELMKEPLLPGQS